MLVRFIDQLKPGMTYLCSISRIPLAHPCMWCFGEEPDTVLRAYTGVDRKKAVLSRLANLHPYTRRGAISSNMPAKKHIQSMVLGTAPIITPDEKRPRPLFALWKLVWTKDASNVVVSPHILDSVLSACVVLYWHFLKFFCIYTLLSSTNALQSPQSASNQSLPTSLSFSLSPQFSQRDSYNTSWAGWVTLNAEIITKPR